MRYELRNGQEGIDTELANALSEENGLSRSARNGAEPGLAFDRNGGGSCRRGNGGNGTDAIDLEPMNAYTLYVTVEENGTSPACKFKKLVKATKHFFDFFTVDDTIGGFRENGSCNSELATVLTVTVYDTDLDTIEIYADFIADDLDLESISIVETEVLGGVFTRSCRKNKRSSR